MVRETQRSVGWRDCDDELRSNARTPSGRGYAMTNTTTSVDQPKIVEEACAALREAFSIGADLGRMGSGPMRAEYLLGAIARARHRLNRVISRRVAAAAQAKAAGGDGTIFALAAVGAGLRPEVREMLEVSGANLRAAIEVMEEELARLSAQQREPVSVTIGGLSR